QVDHPRECYGTCDAGRQEGFHNYRLRGANPRQSYTHGPHRPRLVHENAPRQERIRPISGEASAQLPQLDLVRDLMAQADAADGQHHLRRQLLMAFQAAGRERLAHRLLDLALRGDADLLQETAQTAVEDVLVHCSLPGLVGLFSMYSPRSRCFLSARTTALLRWASRSRRQ